MRFKTYQRRKSRKMPGLISYKPTKVDGAEEPITIEYVKAQNLKVDFSDNDEMINKLIPGARSKCEEILGMVLIDTNVKAVYEAKPNYVYGEKREKNVFEIFYGPVKADSGVPSFGGLPDDAEIIGDDIGVWIETYENKLSITYTAGWDEVPEWAQLAIAKQVAWDFRHLGDDEQKYAAGNMLIAPETMAILSPYRVTLNEYWL